MCQVNAIGKNNHGRIVWKLNEGWEMGVAGFYVKLSDWWQILTLAGSKR